ncbi:MAG TPA: lipoyl(octanoyl) transferase LipB [Acidisarcina sp.]|nr:lipoyl(octanoyl) transferase LipB [Acidisarcina sp.]
MFSYLYLGRTDYARGLALQQQLVELRHQQRIGNTLLFLEHPPVLTLGRNSHRSNILASDELLERRGVEVHEINRGGDVTYHGPGQLVGYPIVDLRSFTPRLGAIEFVRLMEEALIRFCAEYAVSTGRIAGRTGVWTTPNCAAEEKKIAAIGVHISRGITSHGFALNLTTDLRDFGLIVPCGIADKDVTSLENETCQRVPSLEQAANEVARQFGWVFKDQVLAVESLDDLLAGSSAQGASEHLTETPVKEIQRVPDDTPLRVPQELRRLHGEEDSFLA